jgi:hypothetical protein
MKLVPKNPGSLHSKSVRVVCKKCNSGWMSSIVNRAKPVSSPMINGSATSLNQDQMTALAAWVTLATMMAEFDGYEERVIPAEDLVLIRQTKTPPRHWFVSIGRYDGKAWGPIRYNRHRAYPQLGPEVPAEITPECKSLAFQVTTYNLKHLLVQTFCSRDVNAVVRYLAYPYPAGVFRIWPPLETAIQWPTGPGLQDNEAQLFADGFYHSVMSRSGHSDLI